MTDENKDKIESIKKAAQLILKSEVNHLHLVSPAALTLIKLTNDDNASIDNLSFIIETEPTLAAKILKQVNSVAYALPNKITSINRAVVMLGFSTVRQLTLNQLFYSKLAQPNPKQKFDFLYFWQHCLYVASLSKRIAIALKHPDPDMVYTGGLLHDIGKVVLETYGRITYSDFISSIGHNIHSAIDEELNFFGITHTDIGHVFCLEWQLPTSITAIVANHHAQPIEPSPFVKYKTEIAIVSFANYIAWIQGIGSSTKEDHPTLQSTVLDCIDLRQLDFENLLQQADQDLQNTQEFYNIRLPGLNTLRATLIKATIDLSQISAGKTLSANHPSSSCLTIPHQSLNPAEFIPQTLKAIRDEFSFDRCILFSIVPKRRCLTVSYTYPEPMPQSFEVNINDISGLLITCLREKKAVLITNITEPNNPIIQHLKADEFFAIPVLHHNRLVSVLYADNSVSKKPLDEHFLPEIIPITCELGIAIVNAKQYSMVKKNAQIDHLTQLSNKRMIDDLLTELFHKGESKLANIAIGFVDIDKFKLFNDTCGHQAGDDVLKIVADIMHSLTRPEDFIGRYGGEEFLFVLKNTNETGAYGYAERIRSEIERRGKIMGERFNGQQLTVSIGVTLYNRHYTHFTDMIEVADQAMYRAKKEGRNRVVLLPGIEITR